MHATISNKQSPNLVFISNLTRQLFVTWVPEPKNVLEVLLRSGFDGSVEHCQVRSQRSIQLKLEATSAYTLHWYCLSDECSSTKLEVTEKHVCFLSVTSAIHTAIYQQSLTIQLCCVFNASFSHFQLTWADLAFVDATDMFIHIFPNCLDATPLLKDLNSRVLAMPKIKAFMDARPTPYII